MKSRPLVATIACVICLVLLCLGLGFLHRRTTDGPVFAGGVATESADWAIWFFVGGIVAGLVARLCAPRPTGERDKKFWRVLNVAMTLVAVILVIRLASAVLMTATGGYTAMTPSPSGCRVYAEERSFLLLSSGVLWAIPPGQTKAHRVGEFLPDNGAAPVSTGKYKLTWNGNDGDFSYEPDSGRAWEHARITCG